MQVHVGNRHICAVLALACEWRSIYCACVHYRLWWTEWFVVHCLREDARKCLWISLTCLIEVLDDGSVKCWGESTAALGWPRPNPAAMGDKLPAIDLGSVLNNAAVDVQTGCAVAVISDSVKRHLSRGHLSVLNFKFNFIFQCWAHPRRTNCTLTKAASIPARRQKPQGFSDLFFDAAPHLEYFFQVFELSTKAAFAKAAFDTLRSFTALPTGFSFLSATLWNSMGRA